MSDVTRDPALELLRVQRGRLADRMRAPWWYLPGTTVVWGLFFAGPFSSRSFSSPASVSTWAIVVPILVVCLLLQWGMSRATGLKVGPRPGRVLQDGLFYYRPGRTAAIAMFVVSLGGLMAEISLIRHGLLAAAIAVAVPAAAAEVALQLAQFRAIRQYLRDGGSA